MVQTKDGCCYNCERVIMAIPPHEAGSFISISLQYICPLTWPSEFLVLMSLILFIVLIIILIQYTSCAFDGKFETVTILENF